MGGSGTYTQFIMQTLHKNNSRDMDAREALLKYAKEAEEDPQWSTPAYAQTQPKTIFDTSETKRENYKLLESTTQKKCGSCGLKFCTCAANKRK